jgi:lysine-N-methylase
MTRFSCLADRCEDACCEHWTVEVDEPSYGRMKQAWTPEDGNGRPFEELVVLNPAQRGPKHHATMKMGASGSCELLESNRLCGLHRRHGEEVLSNACAIFPRSLQQVGGRVEMAGSLACPEAARLCLLAADAAEPVLVESALLLRPEAARQVEPKERSELAASRLDLLRQYAADLLQEEIWPWRTRLCLLAHFADRLDPILSPSVAEDDSSFELRVRQLHDEIATLGTLEARVELHHWFSSRHIAPGPALASLSAWLLQRTNLPHGKRFGRLAEGLRTTYGPSLENTEALASRYEVRRADLEAKFGARLLQYFRNYALNAWFRDLFIERPSLSDYVHGLVMRMGMLRHLLYAQPEIEDLCTGDDRPPRARDLARLDALTVEVFQAFAKDVEHSPAFLELLEKSRQGGSTWGQSVLYATL